MKTSDILIIGGGIAGMSAGIYAQKNGFNSLILEMHDKPGGQLTSWSRNGYRFDYCLHWLVGTDHGVYRTIWEEIDAITPETEIINHDVFVRTEDQENGEFYLLNDIDKWEAYLLAYAPEDEIAIHKLCNMMRKGDSLDQFEDPPEYRGAMDYLKAAVHMGSFAFTLLKYGKKTCEELFKELNFKNEGIKYFLGKIFEGRDFSALGFIMMMGWAHAKNAGYLKGGSIKMTNRIANKYKELGGGFRYHSRVERIIVEDNRAVGVRLDNGEELYADHIIGACDGHTILYDMLDGRYIPEKVAEAYENWDLFTPLVQIGFGIGKRIESKSHNTNYVVSKPLSFGKTKTNMYSIMNRSSYDETFAPEGKTTLLMQFESPWELWEDLEGDSYYAEKERIRRVAIAELEKRYPGIEQDIEMIDVATPVTTVKFTGVWKGAYEGFMPSTDVMNGLPMELEGLSNFKMIGQWLYPGGGLPPSAQSGKWAVQKIVKESKLEFVH